MALGALACTPFSEVKDCIPGKMYGLNNLTRSFVDGLAANEIAGTGFYI
jgi:hypothetical protein